MAMQELHEVEHAITVSAPAAHVYQLISEIENWPRIFPPTVHADYVERSERAERIRIWATANDDVKNWTSRRVLDPADLRIEFRQEISAPPVAEMGGAWLMEPVSAAECRVRLLHEFRAIDDDPRSLAWIDQAVDSNSRSELAALKANVELDDGSPEGRLFSFADTVRIDGSAKDAYDFLNEAQLWQERLPHVARVELQEKAPGLQILEMDTTAVNGATHTTKSVRVCFPYSKIIYKQVTLPALMNLHTGRWSLVEDGSGVLVTSEHTVVINTANIRKVLGDEAGTSQAREFVKDALSANSRATLGHARKYAETRYAEARS
jgi:aromatase